MFLERLNDISQRIGDARALSLVAADGIPVESVSSEDDLDLEAVTAELMNQVQAIGESHRDLEFGEVHQFSVSTDQMTLMVSSVSDSYFLLLVLGPEGSYGRARFELRRARLLFENDLA
jgi:predicted regulator of Ras-like GTPase activity (Roadblock/LC7/MglB family)